MNRESPTDSELIFNTTHRPRAERHVVQVPLHCRVAPYSPWHLGEIENISASGLLFRSNLRPGVDREVEMSFVLNGEIPGLPPASVVCSGRVVRAIPQPDGTNAIGVAIERRQFVEEPIVTP